MQKQYRCWRCKRWFYSLFGDYCNECQRDIKEDYDRLEQLKELKK